MIQPQNITEYFINKYVNKNDTVIDATMGNGFDTLKLANAVGEGGKVYAFDVQNIAVENTKKLLLENNISNADLILDSHENLDKYVKESVKCVVFNLGYLPGGDHKKQTKKESTISAIEKSLAVLSCEGFISVTVYYGKNSGTEEKEGVMEYFKNLDYKKYTVLVNDFFNRPNNPPLTVIITKN